MKTRNSRLGLSILAGGLSFVGAANAMDIVIDGSYESSTTNITGVVGLGGTVGAGIDGGWTPFTTYTYSANYTMPGPTGSGQVYLRPYNDQVNATTVSQVNSLTRAITTADIDSSQGRYTVSAWFSTYKNQNDYCVLTLQFLDASQSPIGSPVDIGGAAFVAALPRGSGSPANALRYWGKDSRIGLIPSLARYASITTVSTALVNLPDGYVDLVKLDVVAGSVPVQLATATPANNATGVSPAAALTVTLEDGTPTLNTASVLFWYDNSPVTPAIQKVGTTTTVVYDPPGLMGPLSAHTYQVAFDNSGGTTPNTTNQFSFTVAPYVNVNLGTALVLENFDNTAEGKVPTGWAVSSYTEPDIPGLDPGNFHSDTFTNFAVISRSSLSNWFAQVPDGGYYEGTLNVAPNQVINNALVTNLISGRFLVAPGDRAQGTIVADYVVTGDYDLRNKTNVYLSFKDIYTQNQNQMASVEYSTNSGATWLPALYMLDAYRILRDGAGNIDAYNTFAFGWWDVPNVDVPALQGGNFGRSIGVSSNLWSTLAPYISARGDDDEVGSKRVEVIRLPAADGQRNVRFRMALITTYGWYFGIDDFGLYSVSTVSPPLLTSGPEPTPQTIAAGNNAYLTLPEPLGVMPITYQWRHNGANLPGKTGQNLVLPAVGASDAGNYDVVVTNPGGSVTSSVAVVSVVANPPMFVTGQWDFLQGNLKASYGADLQYNGTEGDTTFGTTTSFGVPDIGYPPTSTPVMHFIPSLVGASPWGGYKMYHGAAPNGGGAYVNQYTLIFDIYYPTTSDLKWRSLLQTSTGNANDGDFFVSNWNGVGISSIYDGYVSSGFYFYNWHRIALAVDLSGPGEAPVVSKFIDGVKAVHNIDGTRIGNQILGEGLDGRWSLDPYALVFADNDGDVAEAFVSSIQFSNGRRPDAYLQALGAPNPLKIPGMIRVDRVGGNVVISWTGGVPLQSADSAWGPWTTVPGTVGQATYTPTPTGTAKFYRPQIP